jgi:transposase-like protein
MNKTQTSTRRHFTPQEKVCILKRHLLEDTPVSDLCDEFGIAPSLFYRWQKEFFENGHLAFDNGRKSKAEEDAKNGKIEFSKPSWHARTRCSPNSWRSTPR